MISPELVRRYPFFACLDDAQQKAVAMIADEVSFAKGTAIFDVDQPASALYLLIDGNVSLCISAGGEGNKTAAHFHVGEINPGEPFGISAVLAGETYTSCAQATAKSRAIRIDAAKLSALMSNDRVMGFCLLEQMARAALERLRITHVQLAAAQS